MTTAQVTAEDLRKQKEAEFHDMREVDRNAMSQDKFEAKYSNKKWYSITRGSRQYIDRWLEKHCANKVALDYCCGLGECSLQIAQHGAFVHGIDISAESVRTAEARLTQAGLRNRCHMQVMDAEKLTFPDNTFDVILCTGVLHHLDLNQAYPELARVLKPTGRILCVEPMAHNPLIHLYRKMTPQLRTAWEVEHILTKQDIENASRHFEGVSSRFFHLFTIGATPLRNTPLFSPALSACEMLDAAVLRIPGVKRMAWQIVFELSKPKKFQREVRKAA